MAAVLHGTGCGQQRGGTNEAKERPAAVPEQVEKETPVEERFGGGALLRRAINANLCVGGNGERSA